MSYFCTFSPHHAAIRAERRALAMPSRIPVGAILFGLVGAASAGSAILTLTGL